MYKVQGTDFGGVFAKRYSNLRMGIQAYKNWMEAVVTQTSEFITNVLTIEPTASLSTAADVTDGLTMSDPLDGDLQIGPAIQVPINAYFVDPVTYDLADDVTTLITLTEQAYANALEALDNSDSLEVDERFPEFPLPNVNCDCLIPLSDGTVRMVSIPVEAVSQAVADKLDTAQTHMVAAAAALTNGVTAGDVVSKLAAECTARNMNMPTGLTELTNNLPSTANFGDVLSMLLKDGESLNDASAQPNSPAITFSASNFSNSSGLACGIKAITTRISEIFSTVDFDLGHLKQGFQSLFTALKNMFAYLIELLAPGVLCDYSTNQKFNMEAMDIPFAYGSFKLSDVSPSALISTVLDAGANYLNSGLTYEEANEALVTMAANSSFMSAVLTSVDRSQGFIVLPSGNRISSALTDIDNLLPIGGNITFPTGFGFISMYRASADVIQYWAFYGAWSFNKNNEALCQIVIDSNYDCTFSMPSISDYPVTPIAAPASLGGSNDEATKWAGQFMPTKLTKDDIVNHTDVSQRFVGTPWIGFVSHLLDGPSAGFFHTGRRPSAIISAYDGNFNNPITSPLGAAFCLLCLTLLSVISDSMGPEEWQVVTADYLSTDSLFEFTTEQPLSVVGNFNPAWIPYVRNSTLITPVHAQTDAERADEVLTLAAKILGAALAAGTAVVARKVKKRLQRSALTAKFQRDKIQNELKLKVWRGKEPLTNADLKALKKANRKADRLARWQAGFLGSNAAAEAKEALSGNGKGRDNPASAEDLTALEAQSQRIGLLIYPEFND